MKLEGSGQGGLPGVVGDPATAQSFPSRARNGGWVLRPLKAQGQQSIAWRRSKTWGKQESWEFPRERGGSGSGRASG